MVLARTLVLGKYPLEIELRCSDLGSIELNIFRLFSNFLVRFLGHHGPEIRHGDVTRIHQVINRSRTDHVTILARFQPDPQRVSLPIDHLFA